MIKIEDYAQHQTSGCIGKVIGYGHQMLNSVYLPTLKVQVEGKEAGLLSFLEDISSAWVKVEK